MVMLTPDERRGKRLYKGYFLYIMLKDKKKRLKSYNFLAYPKLYVRKYRKIFQDSSQYIYKGKKVVRAREWEKDLDE